MKTLGTRLALATLLVLGLGLLAVASEEAETETEAVTLTGKIVCAKCTLQKADANGCQNVLVVNEGDTQAEYYLVKNEVAEKYGHQCKGEKGAIVTGTVADKDGKKWLTATKMEAPAA